MNYTILIADDEPLERDALESLLRTRGPGTPTIVVAETGSQAAALAGSQRIDIALLDIRMPGMSGLEVATSIRERNSRAALVFVSAFDYFEYARHAVRLRAEDYLVKPVEDDAVVRVVEAWYARAARDEADAQPLHERFSEAVRFLEQEILDDIVAGHADAGLLERVLELIGVAGLPGRVIAVRPALDEYPFRLETDRQRAIVVGRAVSAIEAALPRGVGRVLARCHPDAGYLVLFGSLETPDRDALTTLAGERAGVSVAVSVSAAFNDARELPHHAVSARRALFHIEGRGGPQHGTADLERTLLSHVVAGDPERAREDAIEFWNQARDDAADLLVFLDRALRLREPGTIATRVISGDTVRSRADFLDRITTLCARAEAADPLARRMDRWVESHFARDVGLPDLARAMSLSVGHCSREFSRLMGTPFGRYLRDRRLAEARRLLAETRLPVHTVATRVGFRDAAYLSRVFRETTGMTPGAWRRINAT